MILNVQRPRNIKKEENEMKEGIAEASSSISTNELKRGRKKNET